MFCSVKNLNGAKRCNSFAKLFPSQLSLPKWITNETAALLDLLHKVILLSLREEKSVEDITEISITSHCLCPQGTTQECKYFAQFGKILNIIALKRIAEKLGFIIFKTRHSGFVQHRLTKSVKNVCDLCAGCTTEFHIQTELIQVVSCEICHPVFTKNNLCIFHFYLGGY